VTDDGNIEYRIELSATFVMDIYSSVLGPPGLDRADIEELIERDWASISADKNILQESQWELISFEELLQTVTGITVHPSPSSEGSVMLVEVDDDRAWVLLATEGASVLYAPEIYMSPGRAVLEAERWALPIAQSKGEVTRPFDGRWRIGDRDVRLVELDWTELDEPWIGTYWDRSGVPDPEAVLLEDRRDALSWIRSPRAPGLEPTSVEELPWLVAASYTVRGEVEEAVAQLAKVVV
jgi:hypothetical protein